MRLLVGFGARSHLKHVPQSEENLPYGFRPPCTPLKVIKWGYMGAHSAPRGPIAPRRLLLGARGAWALLWGTFEGRYHA